MSTKSYKVQRRSPPLVLIQVIAGNNIEVKVGDIVAVKTGKTFYVTGWDENFGMVHATSCCDRKYLITVPAASLGCHFAEV